MDRPRIEKDGRHRVYVDAYNSDQLLIRAQQRVADFVQQQTEFYLLTYAALDVRLCIETTLFEYIEIITSKKPGKRIGALWSAKDLKMEILKLEPDFFRKIEFMRVVNRWIVTPDLDRLCNLYGRFGVYLHRPKNPEQTWGNVEWWKGLLDVLREAILHLREIHSNPRAHINLNEKGQKLFRKFVSGELDSEQLKREFENAEVWPADS